MGSREREKQEREGKCREAWLQWTGGMNSVNVCVITPGNCLHQTKHFVQRMHISKMHFKKTRQATC